MWRAWHTHLMRAAPRDALAHVDGTHSSPRNGAARQFVARYLKKHVRLPEDAVVADGAARDRALELAPWHRARAALPPA